MAHTVLQIGSLKSLQRKEGFGVEGLGLSLYLK